MMNTIGWAGVATLGVFFSCCGWNKLFDPRRSASMRHTMAKHLPWPDHRLWYWFVSMSELVLGLILFLPLVAFMIPAEHGVHLYAVQKFAAAGLYVVCAVAFMLVGFHQIKNEWAPSCPSDWTSSVLYKTEILLMIIALMVIAA